MQTEYSIIITTTPNKDLGKKIANHLIENKLVACVQMFPIESIYTWKDEICNEEEIILFIKSKTILFEQIKNSIKEIHSYEVPEIIQVPITDGLPAYLSWIESCVSG
jgi:periplasmic divalent cation tolerance protein